MSQIPYLEKSIRLALAIVGFPFTALQALLSAYQLHKYKPIGERVWIDERYLHVNATGIPQNHNPTVILESGMGGSTLDWCLVQPELSKLTKVISYDRAGFGWSISPNELPTCQHGVDDLRQLLQNMNLKPELSANQLKSAQPLKHDLQVIVLSAGRQSEEWKKDQEKLLHLTEKTTQIVVEESWHSIQIYQPQAVIDAVKRILDNNRKRSTNV